MDKTKSELEFQLKELKARKDKIQKEIKNDDKSLNLFLKKLLECFKSINNQQKEIESREIILAQLKNNSISLKNDLDFYIKRYKYTENDFKECQISIDNLDKAIIEK